MNNYLPQNLTRAAREIASRHAASGSGIKSTSDPVYSDPRMLMPDAAILGRGRIKVKHRSLVSLRIGDLEIDIRNLDQLVCEEQVCTLGHLMYEIIKKTGALPLAELKTLIRNDFSSIRERREDLAGVRYLDLVSVLNRAPALNIQKQPIAD
jgi:hypothetical protein